MAVATFLLVVMSYLKRIDEHFELDTKMIQ